MIRILGPGLAGAPRVMSSLYRVTPPPESFPFAPIRSCCARTLHRTAGVHVRLYGQSSDRARAGEHAGRIQEGNLGPCQARDRRACRWRALCARSEREQLLRVPSARWPPVAAAQMQRRRGLGLGRRRRRWLRRRRSISGRLSLTDEVDVRWLRTFRGGENRSCAFKAHENGATRQTHRGCMILHLPNNVHN